MGSITVKLSLAFLLVIVVAVGLVAFAANLGAQGQFASYLETGPTIIRLDRAVATLSSYYLRNTRWEGVQGLLESTASSLGGRLVLTDGRGRVLADSGRALTGRTINEATYGEASGIFVNRGQVGVLHFLGPQGGDRPWWEMLGFSGQRSPSVQAAPPTGSGGLTGPGMMGPGMLGPGMMGGMPPAAVQRMIDEMMPGWSSPGVVIGVPEQSYLSGLNNSLWLGGLGAAVVALALAVFSARRISRPLRRLADASSRIAKGDLSQRVEVSSKDELGELAASFNSMAEALDRAEETRRHMLTDIAHELRTPLTVLQGNLEGMLDGVVPFERETVATLHQETQLLSRLVSDLRDLSLAEAGQLKLHRSFTDLASLAQQSMEKMAPQAQAKGIHLETQIADGLPAMEVDADRISQVLANLLSNALRHTPSGGRITLETRKVQDGAEPRLQVSVADTGPGISPEDLPYVFDRFYRADKSRARSTGGTGLGLAIVKQLVEAHEGRVCVQSEFGRGATFCLTLPLPQLAPSNRGAAAARA